MWFRKDYELERVYRDGTKEILTIVADVQPTNDTTVSPIGTTDRAVRIYTDYEIFPSNQPPTQAVKKDLIFYHSIPYKVIKVEHYDGGIISHYEGVAVNYDLQPITIYKPERVSDGMGGYEVSEVKVADAYAKINSANQTMTSGATGSFESVTQTMIIEDDTPVDVTCQIEYKSERYEIFYIDRSKYDVNTVTVQRLHHRG